MKRAKDLFVFGIVGLSVSLAIFFGLSFDDKSYDPLPYVMPWIVFLIIGMSIRFKYVKK